jgi:Fe-Mn family superoxide dismutase
MTPPTYALPSLPYSYEALEPWCPVETLALHHDKHHAAYVKGANDATAALAELDPADTARGSALRQDLTFNLSGHVLHSLFWRTVAPEGVAPGRDLEGRLKSDFGSRSRCEEMLTAACMGVHGSGWGALFADPLTGGLYVGSFHDHQGEHVPLAQVLAVVDVWEHAYYLKYRNDRAAWVKAAVAHLDWKAISDRFGQAVRAVNAA